MRQARRLVLAAALFLADGALAGCTRTVGEGDADVEAARAFEGYPLYWVGERFEQWELEYVAVRPGGFATFIYGTCEIEGWFADGGCPPPLEIQIQPLCTHLDVVAGNPVWKRREVRGAPVGTIDSAPVLFTSRVQVKVYRGQDSDPALPMRALRALRSVNSVEPAMTPTTRSRRRRALCFRVPSPAEAERREPSAQRQQRFVPHEAGFNAGTRRITPGP